MSGVSDYQYLEFEQLLPKLGLDQMVEPETIFPALLQRELEK